MSREWETHFMEVCTHEFTTTAGIKNHMVAMKILVLLTFIRIEQSIISSSRAAITTSKLSTNARYGITSIPLSQASTTV